MRVCFIAPLLVTDAVITEGVDIDMYESTYDIIALLLFGINY